ncbi:T9SS type B sorting domain-containing protein [Fulvivirga sediminis]|uniref:Gliding motility-associated C-terminal domain-containing protein n=1 Tax=Fulvivirga sediminis TaxID=2803949 RepID=A0A937F535_9BACT|nr:gliding motility-associated C-terminal domain-containing protein [Fulvivirga sediminis]MBL3656541.1 gliding motility-associated C-terminal domain-containing protein [Fulvivirga sediminis]
MKIQLRLLRIFAFCIFVSSTIMLKAQTPDPTKMLSCGEINIGDKLYSASSFEGSDNYTLAISDLFYQLPAGTVTNFSFIEGQLLIKGNQGFLYGRLKLSKNGYGVNPVGSEWHMVLQLDATTHNTPNASLGQPKSVTDQWQYFQLNTTESKLYNKNRPTEPITFQNLATDFIVQVGKGANNQNANIFGASSNFDWLYASSGGSGKLAITANSICPELNASIAGTATTCPGESTTLSIGLEGKAPWEVIYKINSVTHTETVTSSPYTFKVTETGQYSLVSVLDDNGFYAKVSGSATVNNYTLPNVSTLPTTKTICSGTDATISISFSGTAPYSLTYNDGGSNKTFTSNSTTANLILPVGSYHFTAVGDDNCSKAIDYTVEVKKEDPLSIAINTPDAFCYNNGKVSLTLTGTGTANTANWSKIGGAGLLEVNGISATYTPAKEDEGKEITFNVEAANGCTPKATATKTVKIYNAVAGFTVSPEPVEGLYIPGIEYTFKANDQGQANYTWDFGNSNNSNEPVVTYTYSEKGEYNVVLDVKNEVCTATESMLIKVRSGNVLYIPNVFSPNASNPENQVVKVYGENILDKNFTFQIYNRWGSVVYRTNNLTEAQATGWKGSSKGEEQENNVFTYIVRGQFENGESFEKTGTITLAK